MNTEANRKMRKDITIAGATAIVMSFLLFFINPFSAPVLVILLLPIMACIFITYLFKVTVPIIFGDISKSKKVRYSVVVAVSVLILFMLGSLKQLTLTDVIIIFAFSFGVSFYLSNNQVLLDRIKSNN